MLITDDEFRRSDINNRAPAFLVSCLFAKYAITHLLANCNTNIDVCETLMPLPQLIERIGLIFDLGLSPSDLNIDRGHLLMKEYTRSTYQG